MTRTTGNVWLCRFAWATAAATLLLIGMGGLVTSHGAGMSVPDWPTSYGYNMFLFPPSYWIGGILYEHSHRLMGSLVGLLTTILAVWLWWAESRRWLRWLGVAAFFGVVLQGVLGGLRVTLYQDQLGVFHAVLAQLFLVLVSAIALFLSRWWVGFSTPSPHSQVGSQGEETRSSWPESQSLPASVLTVRGPAAPSSGAGAAARPLPTSNAVRRLLLGGIVLVLAQLILGASMRHQHAGLAVPDFPLAYGRIWPPMDPASIDAINRRRLDERDQNPITAAHITLHMGHRIGAVLTLVVAGLLAWTTRRLTGELARVRQLAGWWFFLVLVQAGWGVATVLSNKAADVATTHVVLGAASLVWGCMLWLVLARLSPPCTGAVASGTVRPQTNNRFSDTNPLIRSV